MNATKTKEIAKARKVEWEAEQERIADRFLKAKKIAKARWEAEVQKNIASAESQARTPEQITTARRFIRDSNYQGILRIFNDDEGKLVIFYYTKFSGFAPEVYEILPDGSANYF